MSTQEPVRRASAHAGLRLQKELGSLQFFTLAFGAVVGVGWVVVLGDWLRQAGPIGTVIGLDTGGLVMIVIGLCYAEMVALVPVSGGEAAYAYEVFGERSGFATGWLLAFTYIAVTSFEAISIGWIVSALIHGLEGRVIYQVLGGPVRGGTLALGLAGMSLLGLLNYRGVRSAARLQDVIIIALLVMAVIFIVSGVGAGSVSNLRPYFRQDGGSALGGVLALFMTASFWFGGFNVVPQVMEEKAPGTGLGNVGRVIVLSIVVGIVFKTMVVVSASMTMPWQRLLTLELPVAAAFAQAFRSALLAKLVLVAALFGLLSTWNAVLISASRTLFALGRAAFISPRFGRVHPRYGSPAFAVVFTAVVGAIGTLLGRNALIPIVNVSATCLAFAYLVTCLGVLRLRRTEPEKARPFRVPGGRATMVVGAAGAAFSLLLSLYQPYADAKGGFPLEWTLLGVWLLLGAAFWAAAGRLRAQVPESERRRVILGGAAVGPEAQSG